MKFLKSYLNSNNNKSTYKEFCWCSGTGLCSIWWFVFFEFFTPSTLKGHNFLNFLFLMIFSVPNVLIKRVQVLFKHQKQWTPPPRLDPTCLERLNVIVAIQFATNEQVKDLTHMFCFWIPCYKLYKEGLFSCVLTLKYMCHFGMNFKKFNLKAKHKIKNKISWLFFSAFNLVLSYLLTYLSRSYFFTYLCIYEGR
jgi:hypothetical protein